MPLPPQQVEVIGERQDPRDEWDLRTATEADAAAYYMRSIGWITAESPEAFWARTKARANRRRGSR